jgi:hypothetical protein
VMVIVMAMAMVMVAVISSDKTKLENTRNSGVRQQVTK